jgi:hypothetical protein
MAEPLVTSRSRIRRLFEDLGVLLSLGALIAGAGLCLPPPDSESPEPRAESESAIGPAGSTVVFHQVLHIWLSESLVDLAKQDSACSKARSHEELRAILERHGYQGLFYAFKVRVYGANGGFGEVASVRYPYDEPWNFPEFPGFCTLAAGTLPRSDTVDYSSAALHILPASTSRRELLDAIRATQAPSLAPDRGASGLKP